MMQPIPNQSLAFLELNKYPSLNTCRGDVDVTCPMVGRDDTIYHQFRRGESENNLLCSLSDYMPISNLLTNGNFDENADGWTLGSGFAHWLGAEEGGIECSTTGGTTAIVQPFLFLNGAKYRVTITLGDTGDGTVTPYFVHSGGNIAGSAAGGDGVHVCDMVFTGTPDLNDFRILKSLDYTGIILDVKLSIVLEGSTCFTWGDGWQYDYERNQLLHITGSTTPLAFTPTGSPTFEPGQDFRIRIKFESFTNGYLLIKNDTQIVGALVNGVENYYFTSIADDLQLVPSADWDGAIVSVDARMLDRFEEGQIVIINDALEIETDIASLVTYRREWATLALVPSLMELPNACDYKIGFYSHLGEGRPDKYLSTCFDLITPTDCSKLIKAECDGEAWGFVFEGDFYLQQRVQLNLHSPVYPYEDKVGMLSTGSRRRSFASRSKVYMAEIPVDGALDEIGYDCLSLQLKCDKLFLDFDEFFCTEKELSPEWDKSGTSFNAAAKFELTFVDDLVFNRNLSRNASAQFRLYVIAGWTESNSLKNFDKFNLAPGQGMTVILKRIYINGKELIESPIYKSFRKLSTGDMLPDLIISEGINGNTWYFGGPQTNWVQNINQLVNSHIIDESVQFYDNMSIVNVKENTEFIVEISHVNEDSAVMHNYIYTNAGVEWNGDTIIPYVQ